MKRMIVLQYHKVMISVYGVVAKIAPNWKTKMLSLGKATDHFCEFCDILTEKA